MHNLYDRNVVKKDVVGRDLRDRQLFVLSHHILIFCENSTVHVFFVGLYFYLYNKTSKIHSVLILFNADSSL